MLMCEAESHLAASSGVMAVSGTSSSSGSIAKAQYVSQVCHRLCAGTQLRPITYDVCKVLRAACKVREAQHNTQPPLHPLLLEHTPHHRRHTATHTATVPQCLLVVPVAVTPAAVAELHGRPTRPTLGSPHLWGRLQGPQTGPPT